MCAYVSSMKEWYFPLHPSIHPRSHHHPAMMMLSEVAKLSSAMLFLMLVLLLHAWRHAANCSPFHLLRLQSGAPCRIEPALTDFSPSALYSSDKSSLGLSRCRRLFGGRRTTANSRIGQEGRTGECKSRSRLKTGVNGTSSATGLTGIWPDTTTTTTTAAAPSGQTQNELSRWHHCCRPHDMYIYFPHGPSWLSENTTRFTLDRLVELKRILNKCTSKLYSNDSN